MSDLLSSSLVVAWPGDVGAANWPMPLAFGIELPAGRMRGAAGVRVVLPGAASLPAQGTPLGHWHDGSVRWLLVDCVLPAGTELAGDWRVNFAAQNNTVERAGLEVRQSAETIDLDHAGCTLSFDQRTGGWVAQCRGETVAQAELPVVTDAKGRQHAAALKQINVVAAGPVRATVEIQAEYRRLRGLRLVARWSVFAGCDLLEGEITLHNPQRARHRGGLWDLGDPGSILLKDFTQAVSLIEATGAVRYRCEPGQPMLTAAGPLEIYQESSGGEYWDSKNHVNRHGQVPMRLKGYRGQSGDSPLTGVRTQPTFELSNGCVALAAEIEDFWQQFPKALEADSGEVRLRLFPRQFPDVHELQGGEQKTHRIRLLLRTAKQAAASSPDFPRRVQALSLSPASIPGLPDWTNADPATLTRLDELAEEFLTGPRGVYANRERVDDFGWRNWGDLHADHEEQHYHGRDPLISHYNNQFDVLQGFLLQYLRTKDERWMDLAHPLARHVIDIDIYRTSEDRPAYSGGLFWFTDHYLHAQTSSHRTYSRHNSPPRGDYGGGPSACHNFTTGLLLYHLLTGDARARDAVLTLANWVLAQDDGSRTVLGLVDDGPTGMASASSSTLDHRPGRAAGNSINALLDAWLLTSEAKYLAHAEALIRRCVHPQQDIAALELLAAEKHWSYTVFLVSLDKYLRCKATAGQLDDAYEYARDSLVHYGRWMLAHERPYLDRPEELEYPTEAWAAQDLRKANVLGLAALREEPALAESMQAAGQALADRAWSDLASFATRTSARAMAIVMIEGLRDASLRQTTPAAAPAADWEPPQGGRAVYPPHHDFLPQRERVKQRLRSPAGVAALLARVASPARWRRILNHL